MVLLPVIPNSRAEEDAPFAAEVARFNELLAKTVADLTTDASPILLAARRRRTTSTGTPTTAPTPTPPANTGWRGSSRRSSTRPGASRVPTAPPATRNTTFTDGSCLESPRSSWLVTHEVHTARTHRSQGQPTRARHDELRPADGRTDQPRHPGRRPRRGPEFRRHRERVRVGREQGPHRGDHRNLVRPGRPPPREDGARHQGLREHGPRGGDLAQLRPPVGAEHPAGRRRQPPAPPDRLHRPLPVPPHRPAHPVRGDLAGRRGPDPAGQDPLRRLLQLPRLEDRPGQRDRRP